MPGSNRQKTRTKTGRKPGATASQPNFPQHNLGQPYERLHTLGRRDHPDVVHEVADVLRETGADAGARRLLEMVEDESYYDYNVEYTYDDSTDPRCWTPLHALRALGLMGDAAQVGIEYVLTLLDSEDDFLREEAPFYFAYVGEPAIAPLARILGDPEARTYQRVGAGESLSEIGQRHPELRDTIASLLEQAVLAEKEDAALNGFLVCSLCDLGAKETLPVIENAFSEGRVDEEIIDLADVQEHFGLPVTAVRKQWNFDSEEADSQDLNPELDEDGEQPAREPYVAPIKAGRNDHCPCGSGKKYKRCCGAAVS